MFREIAITQALKAPAAKVFAAFLDPVKLARWFFPDNFSVEELKAAVREAGGRARLEASGGVNLSNIRAVAETGVDFISIGDITKNVVAVDLSLRFRQHD